MYFDAHLDLGYFVYWKRYLGETNVIDRYYYDDFVKGGLKLVIAAIYIDDIFLPDMGLKMGLRECNALLDEIEASPQRYMLVKDKADLEKLLESDKIGIVLSLEGLMPIENDLEMLKVFYRLGVRGLGLAWSRRNYAIDGVGAYSQPGRGGLTQFGEEVIRYAEEHGMFIDLSHANDRAVMDVLTFARRPVIASHSNPRVLRDFERNLTDEMIEKILATGGFIGVNGYNKNMSATDEGLDEKTVLRHLEHFLKFGTGVGLGFDMIDKLKEIPQIERRDPAARQGRDVIGDHGQIGKLVKVIENAGWDQSLIEDILWRNLYRYLCNIWS